MLNLDLTLTDNGELLPQLQQFERLSSQSLIDGFSNGSNVRELVVSRASHIDQLLHALWLQLNLSEQLSLIAVGGYGRGELHPYSDIDLLILSKDTISITQQEPLAKFISLLWDCHLIVAHSVRTIEQCVALAKEDITVVTNLMESRLLAGNEDTYQAIQNKTSSKNIWNAREFFEAKLEEKKQRYKKYNGSSYDLEPNIKSSPGGLRDIQLITWLAQRRYYPKRLNQLLEQNIVTRKEYYTLVKCQLFLWKIRFALHLTSNKAEDRLLFDYQKDTADLMGFKDSKNLLAVEKMMKRYYRCVLIVRNISDILLPSIEEDLPGSAFSTVSTLINKDYQIINDRIDAIDPNIFSAQPEQLLKIFHHVALNSKIKGITSTTLRAIRAARNKITQKYRDNENNRKLFIEFWHINHQSSRAMFLMKRSGVLSDYLPAFQKISGQMQYDMFHSYTVDEHTLFLLKNLTEFASSKTKIEFPLCHKIMLKQKKSEVIYLAGLFHDIGKGRGGDHSEIGAIEALDFCQKHSIAQQDSEDICWLVANHLLMSLTAQKRDTSDPKVIESFANLVGNIHRLELLYILTVADIRATSRSLWNSWKDSLLKELAITTMNYLSTSDKNTSSPWKDVKDKALELLAEKHFDITAIKQLWQYLSAPYFAKNTAETVCWHSESILQQLNAYNQQTVVAIRERIDGGGSEIFIYSNDVDDLFATITATLTQHNLNIQAASIYTDSNGFCYDSFFVLNDSGKITISDLNQHLLRQALINNIERLKSEEIIIQRRMPRQFKHFKVNTKIVFSKDEFSHYTRLDIIARDRAGLLALLAQTFKKCSVRLHDARISTLGEKVEDTFIISHIDNSAIDDIDEQNDIARAIKKQLSNR